MWPFSNSKKENMSEIIDKAVDELDCHRHYESYVECLQTKKRNYRICIDVLDQYRYCMASATLKRKKQSKENTNLDKNVINPTVFEKS